MKDKPNKPIGYIFSGIIDGLMLWVLYQLPRWEIPFITPAYPRVLPALTVSLSVQLVLYALLVIVHPLWLHYLAQVAIAVVSTVALAVLLRVFPFDFTRLVGPWLNTAVRVALIVGLVGTLISGLVNIAHFLRALRPRGTASGGSA